MKKVLIWFRNDLRIHDHEALFTASHEGAEILPVFIKEHPIKRNAPFFINGVSHFRTTFLDESLQDLDDSLRAYGGSLLIKDGNVVDVIADACERFGITEVYSSVEYAYDEVIIQEQVDVMLSSKGIKFRMFHNGNLIHPSDLPFDISELPDLFTHFRKKVEESLIIRKCFPKPKEIRFLKFHNENDLQHHEQINTLFKGGESEGLKRLNYYVHEQKLILNYRESRNGLLGMDYSSKFSAWLANGNLSARKIYEEIKSFENKVEKNDSTYWMIFELLWRDFFRLVMMKFGNKLFQRSGLKSVEKAGVLDLKRLNLWCRGNTGEPFIDANMIELKQTGYMSNRGRQNVASYLVHNLGLDWRLGASYFEEMLVDYDVYSNWGNWAYLAGVGNDARESRAFNPIRQSQMYDPDGEYVRFWLQK